MPVPGVRSSPCLVQAFVAGEPLTDYSLPDGSVVEAVKRSCLGQLPHTLILQMKRFEFDYDAMVKLKM